MKKVILEISQNSKENTCARVSFLIKLQASDLLILGNKISYEFREISKHAFFTEHLRPTASVSV